MLDKRRQLRFGMESSEGVEKPKIKPNDNTITAIKIDSFTSVLTKRAKESMESTQQYSLY